MGKQLQLADLITGAAEGQREVGHDRAVVQVSGTP